MRLAKEISNEKIQSLCEKYIQKPTDNGMELRAEELNDLSCSELAVIYCNTDRYLTYVSDEKRDLCIKNMRNIRRQVIYKTTNEKKYVIYEKQAEAPYLYKDKYMLVYTEQPTAEKAVQALTHKYSETVFYIKEIADPGSSFWESAAGLGINEFITDGTKLILSVADFCDQPSESNNKTDSDTPLQTEQKDNTSTDIHKTTNQTQTVQTQTVQTQTAQIQPGHAVCRMCAGAFPSDELTDGLCPACAHKLESITNRAVSRPKVKSKNKVVRTDKSVEQYANFSLIIAFSSIIIYGLTGMYRGIGFIELILGIAALCCGIKSIRVSRKLHIEVSKTALLGILFAIIALSSAIMKISIDPMTL